MAKGSENLPTHISEANRFADRCGAALEAVYRAVAPDADGAARVYQASIEYVLRIVASLLCARQAPASRTCAEPAGRAAAAIERATSGAAEQFEDAVSCLRSRSGLGIFFECPQIAGNSLAFEAAAEAFCRADLGGRVEPIYTETAPAFWLSAAYQRLLAYRPAENGAGVERDISNRKRHGVFFTPPALVSYIIESVLGQLSEPGECTSDCFFPTVLDPAVGGGDFLARAVELGLERARSHGEDAADECLARRAASAVYGVDIDPVALEIARFRVWGACLYADGIGAILNSRLVWLDVLADQFAAELQRQFPEVFNRGGFDAVVGNPPYLASKNGPFRRPAAGRGQTDSYLMFMSAVLGGGLVRPGGLVSMVLPDPVLVRANAASVRRRIITDWTMLSLLHISGAFAEAKVANAIPVLRNAPSGAESFLASRIERAGDRRSFNMRPLQTALELAREIQVQTVSVQDRCEFLYLLEHGDYADTLRLIHGERLALGEYRPPFAPLADLNVSVVYRGEEIGKAAIRGGEGELPILLGGQSVQPYCIAWEGHRIEARNVRKSVDRYLRTKLLIQKSSSHLVAALDLVARGHGGYVFPQSVYAVELTRPGVSEFYLLCLLNSRVLNEYLWRTVTGYKLLQPQIELEDVRRLPIRRIGFITPVTVRESGTAEGIAIFESESLRAVDGAPFEELAAFTRRCLTGNPERSDVVHDLLVHLGRTLVDLTAADRRAPEAETTRRVETTRAAVETVVENLYSCSPAQMSLPV